MKFNGENVPAPTISHATQAVGEGDPLTYVVLGDSTAIAQGGKYSEGYAQQTLQHLAQNYKVIFSNLAVSGARAKDIETKQLPAALRLSPDVYVIAVGANDVTHYTSIASVRASLERVVSAITQQNCDAKIILTGSPDMGSIPRFPQPLRALAGKRTEQVNAAVRNLVATYQLTFAPIAAQTGPAFRKDPTLFAKDKFHPNDRGYKLWTPVIEDALNKALASQPSHCS